MIMQDHLFWRIAWIFDLGQGHKLTKVVAFHLYPKHGILNGTDLINFFLLINFKLQRNKPVTLVQTDIKLNDHIHRQQVLEVVHRCNLNLNKILFLCGLILSHCQGTVELFTLQVNVMLVPSFNIFEGERVIFQRFFQVWKLKSKVLVL